VTRRYKAFISYSWADRTWGEWLHRALETYRAPSGVADGKTLHPIFKDREEEAAGGSVGAAIEAALDASEVLIVICSPRSAQSMWVNHEVAWFKTHKAKAKILALIVDGEPGAASVAGREAEECFPKTLTHKVASDLQPTEEWEDAPLAADARPSGDGKRGAKLKLAAALLGVGLDALVRRDERRRTIRRRFVTSAAFGLAAVLGGLSIFAFNQRDAAVVAQTGAVKARDDAEGIIELILTDLKSDLEGFGTLKSVTAIGNRAIGYYEGQDVKALTPDQLGRRARVLLMLGEADNKRGDLTAALARYETAAATTKEQLTRDPENPQRMFDHAQSVYWVGYIAWQRGDHAAAKRQFTEYHDYAQALAAKDPANEDWQAELDYAYSNLGTLAMDDGDAAEAEGYFRKSLEIALARLADAPEDVERVLATGQSYAWLADALFRQVRLYEARDARIKELKLYESLLSDAVNISALEPASAAAFRLARIELSLGDAISAAEWASKALKYADALLVTAPERTSVIARAALTRATLAEAYILRGQAHDAQRPLREAVELAEKLVTLDGDNTLWSGHVLALPKLLLAKIEPSESIANLDTLILAQRQLIYRSSNATIMGVLCAALAERARTKQAPADWREIIALIGKTEAEQTPDARAVLAEAYTQIGPESEAYRIVGDLFGKGYRHQDFAAFLEEFPALQPQGFAAAPPETP